MEPLENSATSEFWQTRFEAERMPWDRGGTPEDLLAYLESNTVSGKSVLIPGCGSAYEVKTFSDAGCRVVGVDFCEAAIIRARRILGPLAERVIWDDFFNFTCNEQPFDIIYERGFLCSLSSYLWRSWGKRIDEFLGKDGRVLGYFYYGPQDDDGPPFGLKTDDLKELLGHRMIRREDREINDSVSVYAGSERWEVWERVPN